MLEIGPYSVRMAIRDADFAASLALRGRCFGQAGAIADQFDKHCQHVLIYRTQAGDHDHLVCSFRMQLFAAQDAENSYSAQYYDLTMLEAFEGKLLELGRFCVDPEVSDPNVLRLAWGALTNYVDDNHVAMLFGCSSFTGTDPTPYLDSFAMLKAKHLAPPQWHIGHGPQNLFDYSHMALPTLNPKQALASTPPLLRTYLQMGGWVSDHAVIDHEMNTLHVFTGLEISMIPPARQRALRAVLGTDDRQSKSGR